MKMQIILVKKRDFYEIILEKFDKTIPKQGKQCEEKKHLIIFSRLIKNSVTDPHTASEPVKKI